MLPRSCRFHWDSQTEGQGFKSDGAMPFTNSKKLCLNLISTRLKCERKKEWFRFDDLHLSLQSCTIRERVHLPFIDPLDTRYKIQHAPKSSVKLDTPKDERPLQLSSEVVGTVMLGNSTHKEATFCRSYVGILWIYSPYFPPLPWR